MAITYTIEEADLSAAADSIKSLWVDNLAGHTPETAEAKLAMGYLDNPAGRGTAILLYPDGQRDAKGVQGLHPRVFHLGGRRLRAVGLADYAVDAAHRTLGPALMLMRQGTRLGSERFDLVYGLPNAKAAPVCARAGLKRLGAMRRFAKPLATRAQLSKRMPGWLAGPIAPLLDQMLRVADAARALRERPRLRCRAARWDDAALGEMWSQREPSLLLSERTASMLQWRFGRHERGGWHLCLATDAAGKARGYVVWRLNDGFAEIGDFFALDPARLTAPLMLAFTRLARSSGAASMSVGFFGCPAVEEQLQRAGLQLRPGESPVFKAPGASADLDSTECWYLTAFDNDAD